MRRFLFLALCALLFPLSLVAQSASDDEKALLELLNQPITVASSRAMTIRDTPGIVTAFSREDILATGAKDLLEVLRLVPGFEISSDVQGVRSVSVRGLWGTEGKVLIRVDGQEMNELRYASLYLGNNILMDNVQRIEIIRGPGSATYGGFAELAVVNVTTRAADELKGTSGAITLGHTPGGWSEKTAFGAWGGQMGDLKLSLAAYGTRGNQSDRDFQNWDGTTAFAQPMKGGQSFQNDVNFNLGASYKGLNIRLIEDRYAMQDIAAYVQRLEFINRFASVSYAWKATDALTITPWASYRYSRPWFYPFREPERNKDVVRLTGGVTGSWDVSKDFNLVVGAEGYRDEGKAHAAGQTWNATGTDTVSYRDHAFFAQALWMTEWVNVTLGGRYEDHSAAGSAFVPRFGLTKVWDRFHVKFLAAKAFRTPVIENIDQSSAKITPEKTTAYEVEAGYQLSSAWILTVNAFNLKIEDPIVFGNTTNGAYSNLPETGSKGAEATLTWRAYWGFLNLTGAYYEALDNRVPDYAVPGQPKTLVGAPRHKFSAYGNFNLGMGLSLAPSVVYSGERYGYSADFVAAPGAFKPTTVANLFLHWTSQAWKLRGSLGVNNLTDEKHYYIGGYSTASAPIPAQGREVVLRLGYNY